MKDSNKTFITILIIAVLLVGGIMYVVGKEQSTGATTDSAASTQVREFADMNSLKGRSAPDFTLSDKEGVPHRLSDLRGKTVILFFNEGLMCYPACWDQMAQLSSDPRLNTNDVKSYSIVVDAVSNWGSAVSQMPELAKANVLYDADSSVSRMYGMLKTKSSMHYGIYPGHSYVVIDPQGVVRFILDDPRMAINNDLVVNEVAKLLPNNQ